MDEEGSEELYESEEEEVDDSRRDIIGRERGISGLVEGSESRCVEGSVGDVGPSVIVGSSRRGLGVGAQGEAVSMMSDWGGDGTVGEVGNVLGEGGGDRLGGLSMGEPVWDCWGEG